MGVCIPIAMSFCAFSSLCCLADFLPGPGFLEGSLEPLWSSDELLVILLRGGSRRGWEEIVRGNEDLIVSWRWLSWRGGSWGSGGEWGEEGSSSSKDLKGFDVDGNGWVKMGGGEKDANWISRGGFGFGLDYLGFAFFFFDLFPCVFTGFSIFIHFIFF